MKPYVCSVCSGTEFIYVVNSKTGIKNKRRCVSCNYSRVAKWMTGPGRAATNKSRRGTWVKNRTTVFEAYGGKCSCCGETEAMFLTVDHVNGGGTKHRKEIGGADKLYRHIISAGFPDDFRIMCHNCNSGRWRNGGICPHEAYRPRLVINGYFPE